MYSLDVRQLNSLIQLLIIHLSHIDLPVLPNNRILGLGSSCRSEQRQCRLCFVGESSNDNDLNAPLTLSSLDALRRVRVVIELMSGLEPGLVALKHSVYTPEISCLGFLL